MIDSRSMPQYNGIMINNRSDIVIGISIHS